MTNICIDKLTEAKYVLHFDNDGIAHELNEYLSFYAKNYKHMSKYKMGIWNGKIYLFNITTHELPAGLIHDLIKWARAQGYSLDIDPDIHLALKGDKPFIDVKSLMNSFNLPFEPYDYQEQAVETILNHRKCLIISPTSCHTPTDKIIMSDLTCREIQHISVGDYVIGADGTPKEVLKTFSGKSDLYQIKPKGNLAPIVVTGEHILPLTFTNGKKHGSVEESRVIDYVEKSKYYKHISKLQYNQHQIEFNRTVDCELSPYFIGLYLGNGSANCCTITTVDSECINAVMFESNKFNATYDSKDGIHHTIAGTINCENIIFNEFSKIGLKFGSTQYIKCDREIPIQCIQTPIKYRLELLAGFIDADGSLSKNRAYYDIRVKSKKLCDSVSHLAITLGLITIKSIKKVNNVSYYQCCIMGNIGIVPSRIARKSMVKPLSRNPYTSGFDVNKIKQGQYNGIQVNDSLYLHESGMVTHNSGKSFILYSAIRALLQEQGRPRRRILLVVPTTSLVEQMVGDFDGYSQNNDFNTDEMCHMIYSGKEKRNDKSITVTTWQSVYKKRKEWFSHFDAVFVDEAHLASSDSITKLMEKCENAEYRIGLTGTIEDTRTHKLKLTGLFGRVHETITTKELMDRGLVSDLLIKAIVFDHSDSVKKSISKLDYASEIDHIITDERKNKFICRLAITQKGNTLVLFNFVVRHGKPLHEMMTSMNNIGKKVFYVDGDTPVTEREEIRAYTEVNDNVIIIASYGTFSTGINIKNLENVIFAHPFKSKIKILQSIGRILRKSSKNKATLFDLANDFRWKSKINTTMNHFKERLKLYEKSKFNYSIKALKL